MRRTLSLLTLWVVTSGSPAGAQGLPDHAAFSAVLAEHLFGWSIDYAALQAAPQGLDAYLAELAAIHPDSLAAATRDAQLALWINAYNACAMKLVVQHYPIRKAGFPASLVRSLQGVPANSIRQITDTWSREFCYVAGEARSLDGIEHEILRPMGEPRIHFAVNCASRSCPVLAPEAYTAEGLEEQLDAAVRRLLADPENYRLERGSDPVVRLNKVLDWYKGDFGGVDGVVELLLPYLADDDAEYIRSVEPAVEFLEYDWTLNDTAVWGTER
jgi:hypothetical protein